LFYLLNRREQRGFTDADFQPKGNKRPRGNGKGRARGKGKQQQLLQEAAADAPAAAAQQVQAADAPATAEQQAA
jgi:hypothetical protein